MKSTMKFIKQHNKVIILFFIVLCIYLIASIFILRIKTDFPSNLIYFENDIYSNDQDGEINILNVDTITAIEDEFGEGNVTRLSLIQTASTINAVYAVENSFVDTGVTSYNITLEHDVIQNTELIRGGVWEKGSTDRVAIIDESFAEQNGITGNELGYTVTIRGLDFRVVGVVNDIDLIGSDSGDISHIQFTSSAYSYDGNIYIPFYYSGFDFYSEEYKFVDPECVIVKTDGYFDLDDASKKLEEIVYDTHLQQDYKVDLEIYSLQTVYEDELLNIGLVLTVTFYYSVMVVLYYSVKNTFYN